MEKYHWVFVEETGVIRDGLQKYFISAALYNCALCFMLIYGKQGFAYKIWLDFNLFYLQDVRLHLL